MVGLKGIFYILAFLYVPFVHASTIADQYKNEKSKYIEKEVKQRSVLSDLYGIKLEMKRINKEKTRLLSKFSKVQERFDELNRTVETLESQIQTQKDDIRRRIRFIIKFQDLSFLKLIFSSQTPVELDRNLKLLKLLTEKDFASLKSYFKNIKTLISKRDQLKKQKESLAQLKNSVSEKEKELASSKDRKTALLGQIKTQKALTLLKLKQLRIKTMPESIEKSKAQLFLNTLLKPLLFEEKGELDPPAAGQVVQKYGYYHDPVYHTKLRHKGIFIQAPVQSNVSTIYDGEISFTGYIVGFGKTIIVSHGDHYYSVYSHVDEYTVQVGDPVTKNQVIAKTGSTHPFFGSGLYFEIRHFSEPTDPLEWITLTKSRNLGEKNASI